MMHSLLLNHIIPLKRAQIQPTFNWRLRVPLLTNSKALAGLCVCITQHSKKASPDTHTESQATLFLPSGDTPTDHNYRTRAIPRYDLPHTVSRLNPYRASQETLRGFEQYPMGLRAIPYGASTKPCGGFVGRARIPEAPPPINSLPSQY